MKNQEMNLNIRYDLPQSIWEEVIPEIYQTIEGWKGFSQEKDRENLPHWFSFDDGEKHVFASVEPSGLFFCGLMEDSEWEVWKRQFKDVATEKLGFKVGEIELGEVDF